MFDKLIEYVKEEEEADFNPMKEEIHMFIKDLKDKTSNKIPDKEVFKSLKKTYIDLTNNMKCSSGNLVTYWHLLIEMNQVLLNIIFTAGSYDWALLLGSLRDRAWKVS